MGGYKSPIPFGGPDDGHEYLKPPYRPPKDIFEACRQQFLWKIQCVLGIHGQLVRPCEPHLICFWAAQGVAPLLERPGGLLDAVVRPKVAHNSR